MDWEDSQLYKLVSQPCIFATKSSEENIRYFTSINSDLESLGVQVGVTSLVL